MMRRGTRVVAWSWIAGAVLVSAALGEGDASFKELQKRGDRAFEAENYEKAMRLFEAARKKRPENVGIHYRIARASLKLERKERGLRAIKRMGELKPEVTEDKAVAKALPPRARKGDGPFADFTYTNSVGMELVYILPGEFMMGSDSERRGLNEQPHRVKLTEGFWLGATEVTHGQWKTVMGSEPWQGEPTVGEGDDYPATYVSWKMAKGFCEKLSERTDGTYRLPTEAQWEYACRAGTQTAYSFGEDPERLGAYAWYKGNTSDAGEIYAHRVGQKKPNPWGLHDMHGNVYEWCRDWYGEYPRGPVTNPTGPSTGSARVIRPSTGSVRVIRGGGWFSEPRYCRSGRRVWGSPDHRDYDLGFRVLLEVNPAQGRE